jgi:hypothetical protein
MQDARFQAGDIITKKGSSDPILVEKVDFSIYSLHNLRTGMKYRDLVGFVDIDYSLKA